MGKTTGNKQEVTGKSWRVLAKDGETPIELENQGVFDELVVDSWLHIEKMTERTWWMRIGDVRMDVIVQDDGSVDVDLERNVY